MFDPNIHGSYSLFTLSKNLKPVQPRSGVSVGRANRMNFLPMFVVVCMLFKTRTYEAARVASTLHSTTDDGIFNLQHRKTNIGILPTDI